MGEACCGWRLVSRGWIRIGRQTVVFVGRRRGKGRLENGEEMEDIGQVTGNNNGSLRLTESRGLRRWTVVMGAWMPKRGA